MGVNNNMRFEVTFKQGEEWLWNKLSEKSSPNLFTKDVLKEHFRNDDLLKERLPPQQKRSTLPVFKGV
jgi:hypothetical protein